MGPRIRRVGWLILGTVALAGCTFPGAGENSDPRGALKIENQTDYPIVRLTTFPGETPEEKVLRSGLPGNRPVPPGGETSFRLVAMDNDYDQRPLCEKSDHYFFRLIDPTFDWRPSNDERSLDLLELVEVLESPCWDSERPTFTLTTG